MPVGTTFAVAAVAGLVLWALGGGSRGEVVGPGGEEPGGGTGGGGTGGGGGGGVPKPPVKPPAGGGGNVPADVPVNPGGLGGGGVWGDPSKIPADFAWSGNGWWVANDCSAVAIGKGFAPDEFTLASPAVRQSITSLQSVTVLVPGEVAKTGTLWNFLFHLGFDQGLGPEEMIARVKADLNLYCSEVDQWPAGFAAVLEGEIDTFYSDQIEGVE